MTPDPSTTDSAAATAAALLRSSLIHALDRTLLQQQPTLAAVRDAWRNGTTVVAAFLATSPRLASPMVLSIGCGTRAVGHRANQRPLPTNQRKEASYGVEGEEDEATREWSARRVWCCDDLHAEVLARRGLRAALCAHVTALLSVPSPAQQPPQPSSRRAQESPLVAIDHEEQRDGEERTRLTVRWRDDFSLHLLINEVPCGAMSVLSSEAEERCHQQHEEQQRGEEDSVPPAAESDVLGRTTTGAHPLLRTPFRSIDLPHEAEVLKVNAGAWGHQLGVLHCPVTHRLPNISRTKPGKGIPSLCMSCSDKILRWQVEGLLGSTFPSFSSPKVLRLASLCVVLPSSTSSCVVRCLQEVAEAGLNGRLQALLDTTATMPPPPPPPPPSSCFSDSPSLPSSSSTFARVDVCVTTREEEDVMMPDAETVTTKGAEDGSFTCVAWGGPSIGLRKEPDVHQASSSNNTTTTTTTTEGWQLYRLNPKSGGPFSMTESALQRHIASVSAFASASPASSLQTLVQQQQGRRETTGGSEHGSEASRKRQRCNEELQPCSTPPHLLRREGLLSSSVPSSSSYVASVPLSASSKQLMMNPITRWGWRQSATDLADLLSRCGCLRLLVGRREMPHDDDFLLPSSKSSNGGMEVEEEQEKDHVLQHHYDEWKRHVVRQQQWHQQQQQQQQRLMSAAPDREANLMMMIGWEWKEFLRDCRVPMMLWVEKPKKNTRSRVAKSK